MKNEKPFVVHDCVDREFVWELCKRGHVHVLSSQVTITGESLDLSGVKIPNGCEVEFVHGIDRGQHQSPLCKITFGWPKG